MTELVDAQFYAPLKTTLVPTNGAGTFSFARSTTKSIFNSSGVLESVAINAASINNFGLHIESSSRTNNLLYCRDLFSGGKNGKWIPSSYGSDIVANGSFAVDTTGWVGVNATLSVDTNRLKIVLNSTGFSAYAYTELATEIGVSYVISFDNAVDAVTGALFCWAGTTHGAGQLANYSTGGVIGSHYFSFTATTTNTYITFAHTSTAKIGEYSIVDNVTCFRSGISATLSAVGVTDLPNSCSQLTANSANATILQTITAASTPACSGFWVKRAVGTGSIFFTRNGGTDWLDITSLINSSTFTCVKIENTSVTNPQVGFKIASSGDAIIVDAGLNHAGTTLTLPILTTSAAVTRAADVLTYQTASNFSDTAGTILATYKPTYDTYLGGSIVGSSTRGLYASASNSGVQALDGTNTISGPTGTPSGQIKIGARWSGSSLQCFALDSFGSSGSYDGSFNLSTIGILPGTAGYIRDLAIWTSSLTDNEISDAWNLITTYITSGSLVGMQSILSSSTSSISTVIYGSITATYIQPTITATYTIPTIEAEI